jgi:uncharacterized protein involved in exopolysaccharide biosynthesis
MAIDLKVILSAFWRARFWLFPLLALIAATSFVALSMIPPKYKAEAKVIIEARSIRIDQTQKDADADRALLDQEGVASQVQLITSRDIGRRVMQAEKLDRIPEFVKTPGLLQSLLPFLKRGGGISPEEQVLEAYFERLNVYQIEHSRVITIEFTAQDPAVAARIANAVVREYLAGQAEAKVDNSTDTSRWLEGEITGLRSKVAEAEGKVEQWRATHDLFATNRDGTLVEQQLGGMNQQITQVRTEKAAVEARAQQLRKVVEQGGSPESAADLQTSQSYQRLKERETALRSRMAELSATLLPGHPQIRSIQAQISDIQAQERAEARRILSALETEVKISDQKLKDLRSDLGDGKAQAAKANENDIQLRALEREAKAQRDLLETFLARYREAASRQNETALPPDARGISEASAPSLPYFPKVLPLTFLITLASFIIITAIIVLRELVSGRALRPVDLGLERVAADVPEEAPKAKLAPLPASEPNGDPDGPEPDPRGPGRAPVAEPSTVAATRPVVRPLQPALVAAAAPPMASAGAHPADDLSEEERRERQAVTEMVMHTVAAAMPEATRMPELAEVLAHAMAEETGGTIAMLTPIPSPASARAALGAVRLAAEQGKACLIDLARPAVAVSEAGLSDLMAGQASFAEIIQRDTMSSAHLVGFGTADLPETAFDTPRFGIIIDALAASYDTLILHFGGLAGTEPGLAARFARVGQAIVLADDKTSAHGLMWRLADRTDCGLSVAALHSASTADQPLTDAA